MSPSLSGKESSHSKSSDPLAEKRERIRHSASHVMADALRSFYPEVQLAIGPPTDEGFYYDVLLPVGTPALTVEDLPKIEEKMRQIIKADHKFIYKEIDRKEALEMFAKATFKKQIIEGIPADEKLSLYSHGGFTDLCEGPHVNSTGEIKAFKLMSVAGAYWRGDEHNAMLQRIYGTAFESQAALDEHVKNLEEAQKRDHRKLGKDLELFIFDPVAPASPFFLPKGTIVYNELVKYIRELYKKYGYQEVITPQIFSTDLWKRSGHYDNYIDNMYMFEADDREFGVKPMNCPAHAMMYSTRIHSYRELPIRFADFGRLHRFERSGVTHGLTRVRSFAQDDAHIFARPDQVQAEITVFLNQFMETYHMFGFGDIFIRLSLRPEKRTGTDEMWDRAETALENALKANNLKYAPTPGEGAFYGPKLDFLVKDAIGREWQLGTLQLDYSLPERFNLEYAAEDGSIVRPVIIHRAWLGSIERFLGILIEHTAGAFPVWLSPVQAVVVPIADRHAEYAARVAGELVEAGLRAEVDDRKERMNLKIRDAQMKKVPYILVVGDKEAEAGTASVRMRTGEDKGAKPVADVKAEMLQMVAERS